MSVEQMKALGALAFDAITDPDTPPGLKELALKFVNQDDWVPFYTALLLGARSLGLTKR